MASSFASSPAFAAARDPGSRLLPLLRDRFGFAGFRPHQEDVCRSLCDARDVLLVMPTGAGKSLCYQLPGLARGGTTVVVSPLIALMEDQVQKLLEKGFAAARIHSGRSREESREACRQYLRGELDFLFFAPERLAVPGFGEMLAKRTPSLVAIDEAHCISQWGHDFRPEYRMLGERLPALRPAPVVALTATATPVVQDDIVAQLRLQQAVRSIRGFRRENIALEVVDCPPNKRRELAAKAIVDDAHRPAILYAPTRKEAEEVAQEFADEGLSIAAYHAGMSPKQREGIQSAFLKGALDVVVATIAFGMGVDKSDVRTVVHLGLPSSLESYSQEVGRAGRDGKPSRAILLGSLVDTKMHEFFVERDYPPVRRLRQLFDVLGDEPMDPDDARRRCGLSSDDFDKTLEKLWIHGGAIVDVDQRVHVGKDAFEKPYLAQRRHKESQLSSMTRFLNDRGCRQLALLQHFGDDDARGPCGICDACAPDACRVRRSRALSDDEQQWIASIIDRLRRAGHDGTSTGKLHKESVEPLGVDRRSFEHLLGALVRAGRVRLEETSFRNDKGERVPWTRAVLVDDDSDDGAGLAVFVPERDAAAATKKRGRARGAAASSDGDSRRPRPQRTRQGSVDAQWSEASPALVQQLKEYRMAEAARRRAPAFTVLSDRALLGIASAKPGTKDALLAIAGVGQRFVDKHGDAVLAIVADA